MGEVYSTPLPLKSEKEFIRENSVPTYKEVAMENLKPAMVGNTGAGETTIMVNGKEVKICKILDPDCEACQ
jgi:hypothetical protein